MNNIVMLVIFCIDILFFINIIVSTVKHARKHLSERNTVDIAQATSSVVMSLLVLAILVLSAKSCTYIA